MSRVKAQLRAFYAAQGLTGKHRRKAMQYDLKQVKALRTHDMDSDLMFLLLWAESPQGYSYWSSRDNRQPS